MNKPWVTHASQEFANQYVPGNNTVCISITGSSPLGDIGQADPSKNFDAVLRLEFDDVESDKFGKPISAVQAGLIAAFISKHRGKNFFVHCAAGISRSAAIAVVILELYPEYTDGGWSLTGETKVRHPNGLVRSLLKRAVGLVPVGG